MHLSVILLFYLSFSILTNANFVSWKDIDNGQYGSYPTRKFTSSHLRPPYLNFLHHSPVCDDGQYYFISPRGWKVKTPGPMILDGNGTLIWSHHFDNEWGGRTYDFQVQNYKGEDYLTFWLGDDTVRGHGIGHFYMLKSSYDIVHKISTSNNKSADFHQFTITPQGTALLTVFEPIQTDVRPPGLETFDLRKQAAYDCLFQEIEVATGSLIFEWRASSHLNMSLSYRRIETLGQGKPFDWVHINSVDKDDLGNYLISARDLHSLLYVDGRSGEVVWTLGGKGNNFQDLSDGRALNMAWQHDAKFVSKDDFPEIYGKFPSQQGVSTKIIAVFDNAALDLDYEYGMPYSRALLLEVIFPTPGWRSTPQSKAHNLPTLHSTKISEPLSTKDSEKVAGINGTNTAYTVRVIQEYIDPNHVRSSTQGSVQILPQAKGKDSNIFVGYGVNGVMTEFYSNGSMACNIHFAAKTSWESGDVQSFRAYKFPWLGRPTEPPAVTVRRRKAYVSWNGATEVREWLLQTVNTLEKWEDVVLVPKTGFETVVPLRTGEYDATKQYVRILAIDSNGQICKNGVSGGVAPYRFAASFSSHFSAVGIAYSNLALLLLGSATAALLLYRRRIFQRRQITQNRHLD